MLGHTRALPPGGADGRGAGVQGDVDFPQYQNYQKARTSKVIHLVLNPSVSTETAPYNAAIIQICLPLNSSVLNPHLSSEIASYDLRYGEAYFTWLSVKVRRVGDGSDGTPGTNDSDHMCNMDGAAGDRGQGLTLVHFRAQLEKLQDTFMG